MEFEDKIAIVAGAGSAIGRAVALELASRGATVVCAGTDTPLVGLTVRAIEESDGAAHALEVDVRREADAARLVRSTVQRFGRLDILVNNAGLGPGPRGAALGIYHGIRHGAPAIAAAGGGTIVSISSVLGRTDALGSDTGERGADALCAAERHGVLGLTRSFALGYAGRSVRINAVCPPAADGDALARLVADERARAALEAEPALARLDGPGDVARAIAFLASNSAAFITGVAVPVGGGFDAR